MRRQQTEYTEPIYLGMIPSSDTRLGKGYGRYSIQFPETVRDYDVRMEHPRSGLSVYLCNCTPPRDTVSPYIIAANAICFSTILSGRSRQADAPSRDAGNMETRGPCDWTVLFDNCSGKRHLQGNTPQRSVSVMLPKELLRDLIQGSDQFEFLLKTINKKNGAYELNRRPLSPQTQILATQLLDCRLTGVCRDLYMEAKTLELLSLHLQQMGQTRSSATLSLSRSDVERLHESKRILVENLIDPPSIRQLAKQVGINEFKLKKGFREVFGCTVYETLRTERMNMASDLLRDSDMTVGDVAATVGYTNTGHFIALFRKHFGVTPGSLLRQTRRRCIYDF